jgi:hypothetical protein
MVRNKRFERTRKTARIMHDQFLYEIMLQIYAYSTFLQGCNAVARTAIEA